MGALFGGPKIPREQKELNKMRLQSEQARVSEAKDEALKQRVAGTSYGIRTLLGGGSRSGYA